MKKKLIRTTVWKCVKFLENKQSRISTLCPRCTQKMFSATRRRWSPQFTITKVSPPCWQLGDKCSNWREMGTNEPYVITGVTRVVALKEQEMSNHDVKVLISEGTHTHTHKVSQHGCVVTPAVKQGNNRDQSTVSETVESNFSSHSTSRRSRSISCF